MGHCSGERVWGTVVGKGYGALAIYSGERVWGTIVGKGYGAL